MKSLKLLAIPESTYKRLVYLLVKKVLEEEKQEKIKSVKKKIVNIF
ncbi:MAG: hypothetical protein K6U04_13980 [Armatimonadetes bacterium]|nr:hypothetical protein [Armatimonadota bacterium]